MKEEIITLTEKEFNKLNSRYPQDKKSNINHIAERAVEIVQIYFKRKKPGCNFVKPSDGSDLEIKSGSSPERIEIKGTVDSNIAWNKIKVSSDKSYNLLKNDTPLYRVTNVYSETPIICILIYSKDFEMIPEPRWGVNPRGKRREKAPIV